MAKVRSDHVSQIHLCQVDLLNSILSSPVLAFSLGDTKQVVLCGVEKAEILHVFSMQKTVTCMHWMEVVEENRYAGGSVGGKQVMYRLYGGEIGELPLVLFQCSQFVLQVGG